MHLPDGSRATAILVWVLTASAASGACAGRADSCICPAPEGEEAEAPTISSLQANLEEVQVAPRVGATAAVERAFQLSGWYEDGTGRVVSGRFDPFTWKLNPLTEGSTEPGGLVNVSVAPTPQADVTVQLTNDAGSLTDQVTIKRWSTPTAAAAGGDVVMAEHDSKLPPNVVLLQEKQTDNTCTWGRAFAFVGLAAVGEQNAVPCSVSFFSASHAAAFQEGATITDPWVNPGMNIGLPVNALRTVDVTVFIAVTGRTASLLSGMSLTNTAQLTQDVAASAAARAEEDLSWAQAVFEANRVGITLNPTIVPLDPTTVDLTKKVGADPQSCSAPRGLTRFDPLNPGNSYEYRPDAVSVYYVDWIDFPTEPTDPGVRGLECHYWYTGNPGPVVYISYTRHSPITLAHEIGHALGLDHVLSTVSGGINVMDGLADDGPLGANVRSRLTVGQAFRMNVYNDSYLTKLSPLPLTRRCITSEPCPPVELDAR
jgi:hypothetical protein